MTLTPFVIFRNHKSIQIKSLNIVKINKSVMMCLEGLLRSLIPFRNCHQVEERLARFSCFLWRQLSDEYCKNWIYRNGKCTAEFTALFSSVYVTLPPHSSHQLYSILTWAVLHKTTGKQWKT